MGRDIQTTDSDSELSTCSKVDDSIEPSHLQINQKLTCEPKRHSCDFSGCQKTFNRPWKLAAHKNLHYNERPFVCAEEGCSRAFTNTSHLKRHIRTSHEHKDSYQPIKCTEPGCEVLLKTKQYLQRHLKRKHTVLPFKCTHCDTAFGRSQQLKEHMFVHTGIYPYICSTCSRGFGKNYDLQRHKRGHRTHTCRLDNCNEILQSMSAYRKHIAQFHKPKPVCAVCDKVFSTHSNLRQHMSTHAEPQEWICPTADCGQTFTQKKYLKQHWEHVHNTEHRYQCRHPDCDKVFRWKRNYVDHLKLHNTQIPAKKSRRPQRERKDKGKPKTSIAAELANVFISQESHNRLINKEVFTNEDGNISDVSVVSEIIYIPLKEDSTKEISTTSLPLSSL